jgi:hypothetical protein
MVDVWADIYTRLMCHECPPIECGLYGDLCYKCWKQYIINVFLSDAVKNTTVVDNLSTLEDGLYYYYKGPIRLIIKKCNEKGELL